MVHKLWKFVETYFLLPKNTEITSHDIINFYSYKKIKQEHI